MRSIASMMLSVVLSLSAIALCQKAATAQGTFIRIDIAGAATSPSGSLYPYRGTVPVDMNNSGEVTGYYVADSDYAKHQFLYLPGGRTVTSDDPMAGSTSSAPYSQVGTWPYAINDRGVVTGMYSDVNGTGNGYGRTSAGTFENFHEPNANTSIASEQTLPDGINAWGEIAGIYFDTSSVAHGFVRTPGGRYTEFEAPDATTTGFFEGTWPIAINSAGTVVGWYHDAQLVAHPFLRTPDGRFTDFQVPGARTASNTGAYASSVADDGTVIGFYITDNFSSGNFIRLPNGTISSVQVSANPTAANITLTNLNHHGDLAGSFTDAAGVAHAFIRYRGGREVILSDGDAGEAAGQGTYAVKINDAGEVAGYSIDATNLFHGFVWRPR